METTTVRRRRTTTPIARAWNLAKKLDDSEKLELMTMLIESVKPTVAKKHEAQNEEYPLKPYTMEEIKALIDQSEADIAAGRVCDFDEVMDELEKEFAAEDLKYAMAEAV